jgi:signal peptidase
MKKAVKIIVNILAWVFLLLALLVTVIVFSAERNNGVSNIMGFMPMTVESNSMSPTFKKGDLIIVKEIDDVNDLKEGDVITYWTHIDGKRVKNTHRIVEIVDKNGTNGYVTRGDNNTINDTDVISPGAVIGRWTNVKLPVVGRLMNFLRTKTGFFICIVIPMAIFFLFELYKFIATIIEAKRPEPAEIDEEEIKRRAIEEYLASQKQSETKPEPAAEPVDEALEAALQKEREAKAMLEEALNGTSEAAKDTTDISE